MKTIILQISFICGLLSFAGCRDSAGDNDSGVRAAQEEADNNFKSDDGAIVADVATIGDPMLGVQTTPPSIAALELNGLSPGEGVYVRWVYLNTAAADMGIQAGDVIVEINAIGIESMSKLREVVDACAVLDPVRVVVMRRGNRLDLKGRFKRWPTFIIKSELNSSEEKRYRDMQKRIFDAQKNMGQDEYNKMREHRERQLLKQMKRYRDLRKYEFDSGKNMTPEEKYNEMRKHRELLFKPKPNKRAHERREAFLKRKKMLEEGSSSELGGDV